MTPERMGPLACWHSGGSIERRSGSLSQRRARQLFDFYIAEAFAALAAEDLAAAWFCGRTALEIAEAVLAADAWKRTACAGSLRPVSDS